MLTIATLLSGGEGTSTGAKDASVRHLWGIEIKNAIAQVARDNGFHVITADIRDVDPATLERPDILHASPECKNASQAKMNGKESSMDGEIATCIIRYIEKLRPRVFTLENVYPYRHFEAFKRITAALGRFGYFYHFANLNAADFGVPQTRRRLILRAVRGGLVPMLPAPEPWRGWYEAIEDLVDGLPESQFAPWQMAGLPVELRESLLVDSAGYPNKNGVRIAVMRKADEPVNTIVANFARRPMRAFLVGGQFGQPANGKDEPRPPQIQSVDDPAFTVTASYKGDWRGFIVDGANAGSCTLRQAGEPMLTMTASHKGSWRALVASGKVVRMTPRCLARFQSFPDWYELPEKKSLASRVIGNAVPPLMYQKIVAGLARSLQC